MMNTVYTIEEYMKQGFTEAEAYMVRKTDIMFNNWDSLTEKQKDRYYLMTKRLGL